MRRQIPVEVPTSEARRDRIERDVLAGVAAMRAADRADAVVPGPRRRLPWLLAGGAALAAAAAVLLIVTRHGESPREPLASAPSRVVTPAGATSRFTVGDAVIDAGSDTSVEVDKDDGGGVTLVLARGSVDCDVAPRHGRPPFRVIAGDVTVEVVGTRFTVARRPAVRVDVARGKVRVIHGGQTTFVAAGESWPSLEASAPPPPTPEPPPPTPEVPPPAPSEPHRPSSKQAFEAAHALEAKNPVRAARAYRVVAEGGDAYAALALFDLAELHAARGQIDVAVSEYAEYVRRFPSGANAEDAAWRPVDVLRDAGRAEDARAAARAYLRRFPAGSFASLARTIVQP